MIIYFSATGNSRYVANQLAADEERIIFIPDAIDHEIFEYDVEPNENVGIIDGVKFFL